MLGSSPHMQQGINLMFRHRPAEKKALHLAATLGFDRSELFLRLDSFCRGRGAQTFARTATALTILKELASLPIFCTNDRSILILSKGERCRWLSEE